MPENKTAGYLWFDAEFSSLDLDNASFLQVALVGTDANLGRLLPAEDDVNLFIQVDPAKEISPWVKENIPQIVDACHSAKAVSLADAEKALTDYVDRCCGPRADSIGDRPVLAGNSVHNDWILARRLVPSFIDRLHYRLLDVSGLKIQWMDWLQGEAFDKENAANVRQYFPEAVLGDDVGAHNAYFDVQASIAELAYYRSRLAMK